MLATAPVQQWQLEALVLSGRIEVSTLITKDSLRDLTATAWCRARWGVAKLINDCCFLLHPDVLWQSNSHASEGLSGCIPLNRSKCIR